MEVMSRSPPKRSKKGEGPLTKKVHVFVVYCQNCSEHQSFTNHDEARYKSYAQALSKKLSRSVHDVEVLTHQRRVLTALRHYEHIGALTCTPKTSPFTPGTPGSPVPSPPSMRKTVYESDHFVHDHHSPERALGGLPSASSSNNMFDSKQKKRLEPLHHSSSSPNFKAIGGVGMHLPRSEGAPCRCETREIEKMNQPRIGSFEVYAIRSEKTPHEPQNGRSASGSVLIEEGDTRTGSPATPPRSPLTGSESPLNKRRPMWTRASTSVMAVGSPKRHGSPMAAMREMADNSALPRTSGKRAASPSSPARRPVAPLSGPTTGAADAVHAPRKMVTAGDDDSFSSPVEDNVLVRVWSKLDTNQWPDVDKLCDKVGLLFPRPWQWSATSDEEESSGEEDGVGEEGGKGAEGGERRTNGVKRMSEGTIMKLIREALPSEGVDDVGWLDSANKSTLYGRFKPVVAEGLIDRLPWMLKSGRTFPGAERVMCSVPFVIRSIERQGIVTTAAAYEAVRECGAVFEEYHQFVLQHALSLERNPRVAYTLAMQFGLEGVQSDLRSFRKIVKQAKKIIAKFSETSSMQLLPARLRPPPDTDGDKARADNLDRLQLLLKARRLLTQMEVACELGILALLSIDKSRSAKNAVLELGSILSNSKRILSPIFVEEHAMKVSSNKEDLALLIELMVMSYSPPSAGLCVCLKCDLMESVERRAPVLNLLKLEIASRLKMDRAGISPRSVRKVSSSRLREQHSPYLETDEYHIKAAEEDWEGGEEEWWEVYFEVENKRTIGEAQQQELQQMLEIHVPYPDSKITKVWRVPSPVFVTLVLISSRSTRDMPNNQFVEWFWSEFEGSVGSNVRPVTIDSMRTKAVCIVEHEGVAKDICNQLDSQRSKLRTNDIGNIIVASWYCVGGGGANEPGAWTNVKLFTSSTFTDMHCERDHLASNVWPAVRQFASTRRVRFTPIDFRWGGISGDNHPHSTTIAQCLSKIDECFVSRRVVPSTECPSGVEKRPFVVSIAGERVGWVPGAADGPLCWTCGKDWMSHQPSGCVCPPTAHCVSCGVDFDEHCSDMISVDGHTCLRCTRTQEHHHFCDHSIVYPARLKSCVCQQPDIPPATDHEWNPGAQKPRLVCAAKYPWVMEGMYREHSVTQLEVDHSYFRNRDASETFFFVRKLDRKSAKSFDGPTFAITPFYDNMEDIDEPDDSGPLLDMIATVDKSRVQTYTSRFSSFEYEYRAVALKHLEELTEEGHDAHLDQVVRRQRMEAEAEAAIETLPPNEELEKMYPRREQYGNIGGHGVRLSGMFSFGLKVAKAVTGAIAKYYPPMLPSRQLHSHVRERKHQVDTLEIHCTNSIGRCDDIHQIKKTLSSPDCRLTYVRGGHGSGKTTVASRLVNSLKDSPSYDVVYFFVHPWHEASSVIEYITREVWALVAGASWLSKPWWGDIGGSDIGINCLKEALDSYEGMELGSNKIVVVIDGVGDHRLCELLLWLSGRTTAKLVLFGRMVLNNGGKAASDESVRVLELEQHDSEWREEVASLWLQRFKKDQSRVWDEVAIASIICNKGSGGGSGAELLPSARYLQLAAHEAAALSVWDFQRALVKDFPSTTVELWRSVSLPRMCNAYGEDLVTRTFAYLTSAPKGLTESELTSAVFREGQETGEEAQYSSLLLHLRVYCVGMDNDENTILFLPPELRQGMAGFVQGKGRDLREYNDHLRSKQRIFGVLEQLRRVLYLFPLIKAMHQFKRQPPLEWNEDEVDDMEMKPLCGEDVSWLDSDENKELYGRFQPTIAEGLIDRLPWMLKSGRTFPGAERVMCSVPFVIRSIERQGIVTTAAAYEAVKDRGGDYLSYYNFICHYYKELDARPLDAYKCALQFGLPGIQEDADAVKDLVADGERVVQITRLPPNLQNASPIELSVGCQKVLLPLTEAMKLGVQDLLSSDEVVEYNQVANQLQEIVKSGGEMNRLPDQMLEQASSSTPSGFSLLLAADMMRGMSKQEDELDEVHFQVTLQLEDPSADLMDRLPSLRKTVSEGFKVAQERVSAISHEIENADKPSDQGVRSGNLWEDDKAATPARSEAVTTITGGEEESKGEHLGEVTKVVFEVPATEGRKEMESAFKLLLQEPDVKYVCRTAPPVYISMVTIAARQHRSKTEREYQQWFWTELRTVTDHRIRPVSMDYSRTRAVCIVEHEGVAKDICEQLDDSNSTLRKSDVGHVIVASWYCVGGGGANEPGAWTNVKLFTSSTFTDMHCERDHLASNVWPAVRQFASTRRVRFTPIDFRWGGISGDDMRNHATVVKCLSKIDECFVSRRVVPSTECPSGVEKRPFVVSIAGERVGWVPGAADGPLCWTCGKDWTSHQIPGCHCYPRNYCVQCGGDEKDHCDSYISHNGPACVRCNQSQEFHHIFNEPQLVPSCVCQQPDIPPATDHEWNPGAQKPRLVCAAKYPWVMEGMYREHSVTQLEVDHSYFRNRDASETFFFVRKLDRKSAKSFDGPTFAITPFYDNMEDIDEPDDSGPLLDMIATVDKSRVQTYTSRFSSFEYEYRAVALKHLEELIEDKHHFGLVGAIKKTVIKAKAQKAIETLPPNEELEKMYPRREQYGNIGGHGVRLSGMFSFGLKVAKAVTGAIAKYYPPMLPSRQLHSHVRERHLQQSCVDYMSERACGPAVDVTQIVRILEDGDVQANRCMLVYGRPGLGKTTVASRLVNSLKDSPAYDVVYFFVHPWHEASSVIEYITREVWALVAGASWLSKPWWGDIGGSDIGINCLKEALKEYQKQFAQEGSKLVVVIDGVFANLLKRLYSARAAFGATSFVCFSSTQSKRTRYTLQQPSTEVGTTVCNTWLARYGKENAEDIASRIAQKSGSKVCRYIQLAAYEASMVGIFEYHKTIIDSYPDDLSELWSMICLPRLCRMHGSDMVIRAVSILASASRGMSAEEFGKAMFSDDWANPSQEQELEFGNVVASVREFCIPTYGMEGMPLCLRPAFRLGTRNALSALHSYANCNMVSAMFGVIHDAQSLVRGLTTRQAQHEFRAKGLARGKTGESAIDQPIALLSRAHQKHRQSRQALLESAGKQQSPGLSDRQHHQSNTSDRHQQQSNTIHIPETLQAKHPSKKTLGRLATGAVLEQAVELNPTTKVAPGLFGRKKTDDAEHGCQGQGDPFEQTVSSRSMSGSGSPKSLPRYKPTPKETTVRAK